MALSGLHVTCAQTSGPGPRKDVPLLGKAAWSEAPSSGAATANAAPSLSNQAENVFQIYSAVDAYVSIGGNPDAGASPRFFVPAAQLVEVLANPGDRLAWVAA